ncbi:Imm51 family immunity protein [Saccharibacillus sp. CPCC 101409]|uniref:Imm51 family immunity protein n=1 Tax=Saccharibacillus sp. CPCC 101409 TaxID=3058041 RepID=UPI002671E570|nr:Imm51 family immunity protein [Saccharibacillus sp. CPCC 101409]MDO3411882.1 Imm51 family immunity protein [Saccharibacillus sp. CPCC 101409]
MTEQQKSLEPFKWVEHEGGKASIILTAGIYKDEIFATRAEEGFEGSGYDWTSLAAVFLEEKMPHLADRIKFDPEGDMFSAYSDDPESLDLFILGFKEACEDDALIADLFSRAELD